MDASATQLELVDLCNRKYFFERVLKLPVHRTKDYFTFGIVLHRVVERFLRATYKGDVPLPLLTETVENGIYIDGPFLGQSIGDPVVLFPAGWNSKISNTESKLIQKLIAAAIEQGILIRLPGAKVERPFRISISDTMAMVGVIDYSVNGEVHDNKTTSSFKYSKTPETLAESIQMMTYAKAILQEFGGETPERIVLRHNIFLKDPAKPQIKKVETTVSHEDIHNFWDSKILPLVDELVEIRSNEKADWESIRGPKPNVKACTAYGGCPFQAICSKTTTVPQYIEQTSRIVTRPSSKQLTFKDLPSGLPMGILSSKFKGLVAKTEEPAAPTHTELAPPPWAIESCTACKGIGWNTKGNPCGICTDTSDLDPDTLGVEYKEGYIEIQGHRFAGPPIVEEPKIREVQEKPKTGLFSRPVKEEKSTVFTKPATEEKKALFQKVAPQEVVVESEPEEAEEELIQEEIVYEETTSKRGRKKKSFTLAINCIPIRGRGPFKDLCEVHKNLCEALARAKNVDSYYQLNAFDRRDWINSKIDQIVESLNGGCYICRPDDPDLKSFVDALRPHASEVWEPIASTVTVVNQYVAQ